MKHYVSKHNETQEPKTIQENPHFTGLSIKIGPHFCENVEITTSEFGRLKVAVEAANEFKAIKLFTPQRILLTLKNQVVLSGSWHITEINSLNNRQILTLEIDDYEIIRAFASKINPDTLYRTSKFRLLKLENSHDAKAISLHMTELSDFPVNVPCQISSHDQFVESNFNFSAKRKYLESLDIDIELETFPFKPGDKIMVDYVFLSVRFLFQCQIESIDIDFKTASLKFPNSILSVTARMFERWNTELPILVKLNNGSIRIQGKITKLSLYGAEIESHSEFPDNLGTSEAEICSNDLTICIFGTLKRIYKTKVAIQFDYNKSKSSIRDIFNQQADINLSVRKEGNYQEFEKLLVSVGYGPHSEENPSEWKDLTFNGWRIQDTLFPGNTIGGHGRDGLSVSCSAIPISKHIICAHSLAMEKDVFGILNFYDVFLHNIAWTEFIPYIDYFSSSCRFRSSFSGRIHTVFECVQTPESFSIHDTWVIYPDPSDKNHYNTSYSLREIATLGNYPVNGIYNLIIQLLKDPHPNLTQHHNVRIFEVLNSTGSIAGLIIGHNTPKYLTAVNITRCAWVFVFDESTDIDQLYSCIQNNEYLNDLEVDIISENFAGLARGVSHNRKQEPVFWYFIHKDDLGPVITSMKRAAWSVLRKYGSEVNDYLKRLLM